MTKGSLLLVLVAWVLWSTTTHLGAQIDTEDDFQLPQLHQLPWSLRKDLPPLKISLHYYNEDADQRFVKFGDQRAMENDVLGQELWLREIRPDGVIIEFRTTYFLLKH